MYSSESSTNVLEKEKMLRDSFIKAKDDKIAELEGLVKKFRDANEEKNQFLKKLGISATGEYKRISCFLNELRAENSNLRNKILEQEVEIQNLKAALSPKEAR